MSDPQVLKEVNYACTKSILFVDDDKEDRDIFQHALKEIHPDFTFQSANDGLDALNSLNSKNPPACIYIDVNMPRMNGLQLLQALHLHPVYSRIPMFVISSGYHAEDVPAIKVMGARDFLPKPASYEAYIELLKDVLRSI